MRDSMCSVCINACVSESQVIHLSSLRVSAAGGEFVFPPSSSFFFFFFSWTFCQVFDRRNLSPANDSFALLTLLHQKRARREVHAVHRLISVFLCFYMFIDLLLLLLSILSSTTDKHYGYTSYFVPMCLQFHALLDP